MAGQCGPTCPFEEGFYQYDPSVGGNAFLLALYASLAIIVMYLGLRFRIFLFSVVLSTGLLLEVLGFIGRLLLHGSRDNETGFFLSQFGTVLGPTFISAAILLLLPHIIRVYGSHVCPFRPVTTCLALYGLALLAFILQLAGVVIVSFSFEGVSRQDGADITAAGLSIQAAMLLAFTCLHFWLTLGLSQPSESHGLRRTKIYSTLPFKRFVMALQAATTVLLVYSIYRTIEFAGGVASSMFQDQPAFMVMGGAFPSLACILMTVFHPGAAFDQAWSASSQRGYRTRGPPEPIETGLPIHHRYHPEIRKQISPLSARQVRQSLNPPELPAGSPGLPMNPKPIAKSPSACVTPTPTSSSRTPTASSRPSSMQDRRLSTRQERHSQQLKKDMVSSDELW